jgi:hypothetical protein
LAWSTVATASTTFSSVGFVIARGTPHLSERSPWVPPPLLYLESMARPRTRTDHGRPRRRGRPSRGYDRGSAVSINAPIDWSGKPLHLCRVSSCNTKQSITVSGASMPRSPGSIRRLAGGHRGACEVLRSDFLHVCIIAEALIESLGGGFGFRSCKRLPGSSSKNRVTSELATTGPELGSGFRFRSARVPDLKIGT